MRLKQSKAGNNTRGKSKGLNEKPRTFIDRRLKHIFAWEKAKRLDKKKALYYNGKKGGKMIKAKQITISVRCSKTLYDRIKLLSDRLETSKGEVMRRALNAYLELLKVAEKKIKAKGGE